MSKIKKNYGKYKKEFVKPPVPKMGFGGGFNGALSDGTQGAMFGSQFGPWGTAIGAGAGAIYGAINGSKQEDNQNKLIRQEQLTSGDNYLHNTPQPNQGFYQGQMYAAMGGKKYATGGEVPINQVNSEVENNEVSKDPNGITTEYSGATHEQGGIPTNLQPGEIVFSDRIKVPGTKFTFADQAKKFKTDKFKTIIDDKNATQLAKKTAIKMFSKNNEVLDNLFNEQESLKQDKLNKSINRAYMKYGGKMPKYANGGEYNFMNDINNQNKPLGFENNDFVPNKIDNINLTDTSSNQIQGTLKNVGTDNINSNTITRSPFTPSSEPRDYSQIGTTLATIGLNALGPATYLTQQGKNYDRVTYPTLTPKYLNYNTARQDANQEAMITRGNLASATGGNSGAYLSNSIGTQNANTTNKARITEAEQNGNTGIYNSASQFNIGNKIAGMRDEAANKGVALSKYYDSIDQLGHIGAKGVDDYTGYKMDDRKLGMLKGMFPDFDFNQKDWRYKFIAKTGQSPEYIAGKPTDGTYFSGTYKR